MSAYSTLNLSEIIAIDINIAKTKLDFDKDTFLHNTYIKITDRNGNLFSIALYSDADAPKITLTRP